MNIQHRELAAGGWDKLPFVEQMANIGSEVERAIKWRARKNPEYSRLALDRALELIGLSLAGEKKFPRLKELARVREALADYFVFGNSYGSTDEKWHSYFYPFNFAARAARP